MNADAFREYYGYHFSENRSTWDRYIVPLTDEQFTRDAGYSRGSVRNQVIHLMNVDEAWFGGLRGVEPAAEDETDGLVARGAIRARWDRVEAEMQAYLADLRDDMLLDKPWTEGEDKDLVLWQVLLHVVNHGTDHRAQLLRLLDDLGIRTSSQDYVFYAYEHPA